MKTVFISSLKPFLDAIAEQMELYVPKKVDEHYVFSKYDPSVSAAPEFNNVRACTPVKEFLFPIRELAATYPEPSAEVAKVKPFAVFGLKECDLRSIEVLDKVFLEEDFKDALYAKRRENMFMISADCFDPAESCFCNVFDGHGYPSGGFDLNVSKVENGFVVEAGSKKGQDFIKNHSQVFTDANEAVLAERDKKRIETQKQLEKQNSDLKMDTPLGEVLQNSQDSEVFDIEAKGCIECQACTRVCPTCHCFYLYDTKQKDYFTKMKMWDSCMRCGYTAVAGGANPNKVLGERIKHRLMHKFVHFLNRYGIDMCVGCGRCVDAEPGGMDIRQVLKKLSEEFKKKDQKQTKATK